MLNTCNFNGLLLGVLTQRPEDRHADFAAGVRVSSQAHPYVSYGAGSRHVSEGGKGSSTAADNAERLVDARVAEALVAAAAVLPARADVLVTDMLDYRCTSAHLGPLEFMLPRMCKTFKSFDKTMCIPRVIMLHTHRLTLSADATKTLGA